MFFQRVEILRIRPEQQQQLKYANAQRLSGYTHTHTRAYSYVVCVRSWHSYFLAATHPQCSSWPNNCAPAALIFGTRRRPHRAAAPIWFAVSTRRCRDDRRSESADLSYRYTCPRWVCADPDCVSRRPNGAEKRRNKLRVGRNAYLKFALLIQIYTILFLNYTSNLSQFTLFQILSHFASNR